MKKGFTRLSAIALVVLCLVAVLAVPAGAKTDLPAVISQAKEGVVKLYVVGFLTDNTSYYDSSSCVATVGSGFAVGDKGENPEYFVTNWHVASCFLSEYNYSFDSSHVRIWIMLDNFTVSDVNGLPSEATAVECNIVRMAESGYPDYAILKAVRPIKDVTPMAIKDSTQMKQGETVVSLGCPQVIDAQSRDIGSNEITTTTGSVARHMVMTSAGNTNVLLHNALISGGNSGGPLIDEKGNVVGLNTYTVQDNYACAVYTEYVTEILDELGIPYRKAGLTSSTLTVVAAGASAAVVLLAVFLILRARKPANSSNGNHNGVVKDTAPVSRTGFRIQLPDGRIVPIQKGKVTLGRDTSCQIRIPEKYTKVSRRHCTLENGGEYLILVDEGSSNGTYIHGKMVPKGSKVALKPGSTFCLGDSETRITVL